MWLWLCYLPHHRVLRFLRRSYTLSLVLASAFSSVFGMVNYLLAYFLYYDEAPILFLNFEFSFGLET